MVVVSSFKLYGPLIKAPARLLIKQSLLARLLAHLLASNFYVMLTSFYFFTELNKTQLLSL